MDQASWRTLQSRLRLARHWTKCPIIQSTIFQKREHGLTMTRIISDIFFVQWCSDAVQQSEEPAPAAVHFLSSTRQASPKQFRPVNPHLLVSFLNSEQSVVCFNVRFIIIAALDEYPIAGRVQICSQNWAGITIGPWILETVQSYQLKLESIPVQ